MFKFYFLENEALNGKILLHIFDLFFREESLLTGLYHLLQDTLYIVNESIANETSILRVKISIR